MGTIVRIFKKIARTYRSKRDRALLEKYFNDTWYLETYPDVKNAGYDPRKHYLRHGWREGRDPTPSFCTSFYLDSNSDVADENINPFVHYIKFGLKEGRSPQRISSPTAEVVFEYRPFDVHARAFHSVQDQSFPAAVENAENVFVMIIPEHNDMSGGIYSFFSIAKTVYDLRFKHNYSVIIMTRPNRHDVTFVRQRNFRNSEDVFRFEQIVRCAKARNIYLQIPEYAAPDFISSLHPDVLHYLKSREKLYVNILNQKIDIMPESEGFDDLRAIADEVTQSVAHHAYFSQAFADRYNLPTLLLPAYTDLSGYAPLKFSEKEKLIIYSPDDSPWRSAALNILKAELPDYKLVEIRGITFDKFMDLATRCKYSITFGEGFDGYLAQPIHQGGVSFAVYNEEFFPTPDMQDFENIFRSSEDFLDNIVSTIRRLDSSPVAYEEVNLKMIEVYDDLYSKDDYVDRVSRLVQRSFDYYPLHQSLR